MSINVRSPHGRSMSAINVTPMADIMIVLLIIFMVATPFISGSNRNLPPAGHTRPRPDDPGAVVVALLADRSATVGAARFQSAEALLPYLRTRLALLSPEDRLVYLKADESLPQEEVQKVLEACREADVEEISLITAPRTGRR
jgi:biopolymer transport protein ExbD